MKQIYFVQVVAKTNPSTRPVEYACSTSQEVMRLIDANPNCVLQVNAVSVFDNDPDSTLPKDE